MAELSDRRRELESAYLNTDYVVDDGPATIIRLDRENRELDAWLRASGADRWAFLTACNPHSKQLTRQENDERQDELAAMLAKQGYAYYRGRGVGDDWEEDSLFIVDIERETAISIARQFEQNAILWGSIDAGAELIWCAE